MKTKLTRALLVNGGPPGVLYEFMVAVFYYSFISASIAEVQSDFLDLIFQNHASSKTAWSNETLQLASSIPSAGGIYHWASVTPGPRYGRVLGFYGGFVNFFGWLFDLASIVYIMSELLVQMYFLYHPNYVIKPWNLYVALILVNWICIGVTIFFNRYLPGMELCTFLCENFWYTDDYISSQHIRSSHGRWGWFSYHHHFGCHAK